jgi:tetratricopeptide (TPR) repeat protein
MGRNAARVILLSCVLAVAGRASADTAAAKLDAFVAPLRAGQFEQLEEQLARLARENTRDEEGAPLLPQVIERLTAAVATDETLTPLLARWAKAAPRSRFEPWVRSKLEVRFAWRARGANYANDVEQDAWPAWYAHLDLADAALAEAAKRAPDLADPHAQRVWVALLRGRPKQELRTHFEAALRIDPTNESAHNYLLTALTPRWGGTHEAVLAFARHAVEQHPEDVRLGLLLNRAHFEVIGDLPEPEIQRHFRGPGVWEELSRVLTRFLDAYPDSLWGHNVLALVSGYAGKKDIALREFRWIDGRWDPKVWEDHGEFRRIHAWASTAAGPAARSDAAH